MIAEMVQRSKTKKCEYKLLTGLLCVILNRVTALLQHCQLDQRSGLVLSSTASETRQAVLVFWVKESV